MELGGLFASIIGDDTPKLPKLLVGDFSFVVKTSMVGPEVVVAIVDTPACIEVDINIDDLALKGVVQRVEGDLNGFSEDDFSTIRARYSGHLLDTARVGEGNVC